MKYRITLQNTVYEVDVEKGNATLLDEYEAKAPALSATQTVAPVAAAPVAAPVAATPVVGGSGRPVPAPLGGLIVAVKCKVGDKLKCGDVFMIVEAMKMENDINAPFDGTVTAIHVNKGQNVQAGDLLIEMA